MIVVSYVLSENPVLLREQKAVNLARADLVDLCYSCFGCDLTLKIDDADFSIVTDGGVQLLDFAIEFFTATRKTASGSAGRVTFAGMADEIDLKPEGDSVQVSANYTDDVARAAKSQLSGASRKFLVEVLRDLDALYPDFRRNKNVNKVRSWVGLKTS